MTIDPAIIEQLKKETELSKYIASRGISLTKVGNNYKGLCPFHEESAPSFTVNPNENLWHCFGCGAGGDIFSFVERLDHVGFVKAVRLVAGKEKRLFESKAVMIENGNGKREGGSGEIAAAVTVSRPRNKRMDPPWIYGFNEPELIQ